MIEANCTLSLPHCGGTPCTCKDCNIKKESKVDAYIPVNFLHILTNFVPQKMEYKYLLYSLFYVTVLMCIIISYWNNNIGNLHNSYMDNMY